MLEYSQLTSVRATSGLGSAKASAMNETSGGSCLTVSQRKLIAACFLSCALDAFDFFALVFVLRDIALAFSTSVKVTTIAILLTIIMRPIGGLLFHVAATRYGWRPTLLIDVLLFICLELASASALSVAGFLVIRAIYGIAMGGEWRV